MQSIEKLLVVFQETNPPRGLDLQLWFAFTIVNFIPVLHSLFWWTILDLASGVFHKSPASNIWKLWWLRQTSRLTQPSGGSRSRDKWRGDGTLKNVFTLWRFWWPRSCGPRLCFKYKVGPMPRSATATENKHGKIHSRVLGSPSPLWLQILIVRIKNRSTVWPLLWFLKNFSFATVLGLYPVVNEVSTFFVRK